MATYNTKATLKQKTALKKMVENGGNISKAMRDAGYSKQTAKNPSKLTKSKSWQQLMDEFLPDAKIIKVIQEGLEANRTISATVVVKSDDPKVRTKQATARDVDFIDVPDHATRHKFVETAVKIKNKLPATKTDITTDGLPIEVVSYRKKDNG